MPAYRFGIKKAKMLKLLFDKGVDPFRQNRLGENMLYILAAMPVDKEIKLLKALFDQSGPMLYLNQQNMYGDTTFVIAVTSYNIDAARLILEVGANPNIKGEYRNTAYQYIYQQGINEMLKLLYRFGADTLDCMDLL